MSKLSALCMKNEIFRNIVSTKVYECVGKSKFDIGTETKADRKRKRQQREIGEKVFGEFYRAQKQAANLLAEQDGDNSKTFNTSETP